MKESLFKDREVTIQNEDCEINLKDQPQADVVPSEETMSCKTRSVDEIITEIKEEVAKEHNYRQVITDAYQSVLISKLKILKVYLERKMDSKKFTAYLNELALYNAEYGLGGKKLDIPKFTIDCKRSLAYYFRYIVQDLTNCDVTLHEEISNLCEGINHNIRVIKARLSSWIDII